MSTSARKLCLVLLFGAILAAPVAAQSDIDLKTATGDALGGYVPDGTCTAIDDDAYDGSIATMTCLTVPGEDLIIEGVTVDLSMNHSWAGDLVVKVISPEGTVSTVMSRPGFDDMADDGTGCCGDSSDLTETAPFSFDNGAGDSAEDMGSTIGGGEFICQDDGICSYSPAPGSGPGVDLSDFNGELASGDWMVCVGDSAGGDTGDVCSASVNISGSPPVSLIDVPTMSYSGLALLFLMLAGVGCWMIFRR
ncbi:MAG: proprotein convertase P-domain-containing protein [Acidobacteriota bacterium]